MGIILVWIGGQKFANPSAAVGLIDASPFAFLASNGFVYMLGLGEIIVGVLLFANFQAKYLGIVTMLLFVATWRSSRPRPGLSTATPVSRCSSCLANFC
jgi:uncharacterized membrane protein YkgB